MRTIHVVKTLVQQYGGPARSTQGLVAALEAAGVESWLVSLEDGGDPYVKGVNHFRVLGGGVRETKRRMMALIDEIKPDLIHTHDLWMPKLHMCHMAARVKGVPYVIAPRGTLEEWSLKQKWLKKWIALKTYQGYDLRHAAAVHATVEEESARCRLFCGNVPVIVSPNGVNVPEGDIGLGRRSRSTEEFANSSVVVRRALYLSRMHPKKGVENLIRAWAKVRPEGWVCELVYSLNDDFERAYEQKMKDEARRLGIENQILFAGAVRDDKKWEKYAQADLFVLPTNSENFGIVVAEALWAGVPVITTKGAPWGELLTSRAGWWVDIGAEPFAVALREATSLSDEQRREMGQRGHNLISEKYSWPSIGRDMAQKYQMILKR